MHTSRLYHALLCAVPLVLSVFLGAARAQQNPPESAAPSAAESVPEAAPLSDQPPDSAKNLRVSALIQFEGGVKVGFVDPVEKETFFLGEGQRKQGVELVSADFDQERVVLRKDGVTWALQLEKDPNAKPIPLSSQGAGNTAAVYRGEGIESFLREHPEAVVKGNVPILQPPPPGTPPVKGFGPGIEKFLAENPELAKKARTPAVGKGETIERMLKEHPELAEKVNKPVVGKGEGIESFLREHPEAQPQGPGIPPSALPEGVAPSAP